MPEIKIIVELLATIVMVVLIGILVKDSKKGEKLMDTLTRIALKHDVKLGDHEQRIDKIESTKSK